MLRRRLDSTEHGDLSVTDVTTSQTWLAASARQVTTREEIGGKVAAAEPGDDERLATVAQDARDDVAAPEGDVVVRHGYFLNCLKPMTR